MDRRIEDQQEIERDSTGVHDQSCSAWTMAASLFSRRRPGASCSRRRRGIESERERTARWRPPLAADLRESVHQNMLMLTPVAEPCFEQGMLAVKPAYLKSPSNSPPNCLPNPTRSRYSQSIPTQPRKKCPNRVTRDGLDDEFENGVRSSSLRRETQDEVDSQSRRHRRAIRVARPATAMAAMEM